MWSKTAQKPPHQHLPLVVCPPGLWQVLRVAFCLVTTSSQASQSNSMGPFPIGADCSSKRSNWVGRDLRPALRPRQQIVLQKGCKPRLPHRCWMHPSPQAMAHRRMLRLKLASAQAACSPCGPWRQSFTRFRSGDVGGRDGCVGGFLVLSLSIPAFEAAGLVYLSQLAIGQRFGLGSLRVFRAGCFQDPKETKL